MKKLHSGGVMCEKSLVSLVLVLFLLAIFLLPRFYLFAFPCPFVLFPSLFSLPFPLLLHSVYSTIRGLAEGCLCPRLEVTYVHGRW